MTRDPVHVAVAFVVAVLVLAFLFAWVEDRLMR